MALKPKLTPKAVKAMLSDLPPVSGLEVIVLMAKAEIGAGATIINGAIKALGRAGFSDAEIMKIAGETWSTVVGYRVEVRAAPTPKAKRAAKKEDA